MQQSFHFDYLGSIVTITVEDDGESDRQKYWVSYKGHLFVIWETMQNMGSSEYVVYSQDVTPSEPPLPADLIRQAVCGLKDLPFFPKTGGKDSSLEPDQWGYDFLMKSRFSSSLGYAAHASEGRRAYVNSQLWRQDDEVYFIENTSRVFIDA